MHVRRLVKAGQTSHTVALPSNWVSKNKLKKGDVVYIKEKSDTELAILPEVSEEKKEKKEFMLNIDECDVGVIEREITAAYINNYSSICLTGKSIDKKAASIRKMVQNFSALEIAEQTSSKIVAQDLLNLKEVSVDKTVRRMDIIVRSMLQDMVQSVTGKSVAEAVNHKDSDINRLYFLMYRLLKGSLVDPSIASEVNVNQEDLLSTWYLVINLENLADNTKTTCLSLKDTKSSKELQELFKDIESQYLEVMKAYYNKDKGKAHEVASRRAEIIKRCYSFVNKNKSAVKVGNHVEEFENMVGNIARIVIDHE